MTELMDEKEIKRALTRISHEILERNRGCKSLVLIGIRTRGVHLAQRIGAKIKEIEKEDVPVGIIDITLYRDDLHKDIPQHAVKKTEIPFSLARFVGGMTVSDTVVMLALLMVYIILGFFMDIMAVMVLTMPIIFPIILATGIDHVWFAVLVVLSVMMGLVTPPVGIVVYAVGGLVRDVPLFTIFRGIWPFLYAMLIALVILIAFPQISLWLPSMMRPG